MDPGLCSALRAHLGQHRPSDLGCRQVLGLQHPNSMLRPQALLHAAPRSSMQASLHPHTTPGSAAQRGPHQEQERPLEAWLQQAVCERGTAEPRGFSCCLRMLLSWQGCSNQRQAGMERAGHELAPTDSKQGVPH